MMRYARSAARRARRSGSGFALRWSLGACVAVFTFVIANRAADIPRSSDNDSFAAAGAARIEAIVSPLKIPADGRIRVRYQISNLGQSPLLASDSDLAGAFMRLVVRDSDGKEIPSGTSSDASFYGKLTSAQKLARFWFVIPKGHFAGSSFEVDLGGKPKIKAGARYALSVRLISEPDSRITRDDIETVAPNGTRVLKGQFESDPVWITTEPACCKAPKK